MLEMSTEVDNKTTELIQAVLESDEYKKYIGIRDKVAKDPELHQKINEFRIHNFQIQNSSEILDMYEELNRLSHEADEFRSNPLVDEYLRRELRICRMIQKIAVRVAASVDLDLDGIAEQLPF